MLVFVVLRATGPPLEAQAVPPVSLGPTVLQQGQHHLHLVLAALQTPFVQPLACLLQRIAQFLSSAALVQGCAAALDTGLALVPHHAMPALLIRTALPLVLLHPHLVLLVAHCCSLALHLLYAALMDTGLHPQPAPAMHALQGLGVALQAQIPFYSVHRAHQGRGQALLDSPPSLSALSAPRAIFAPQIPHPQLNALLIHSTTTLAVQQRQRV